MTIKKEFYKTLYPNKSCVYLYCNDNEFYQMIEKLRKIVNKMHKRVRANLLAEIDEDLDETNGTDLWWRYNAVASMLWFEGWGKLVNWEN